MNHRPAVTEREEARGVDLLVVGVAVQPLRVFTVASSVLVPPTSLGGSQKLSSARSTASRGTRAGICPMSGHLNLSGPGPGSAG